MGAGKRKAEFEDDYGSGSITGSSTQPPRPKRQKKDPAPDVEKRLARYKKSCPKNIMDRVDRVMTQRFFLIERTRTDGQPREEFKVLGSTGNVYTVTVDRLPSCDCPDATKGNHCKHILFVLLKVLSVSISSPYYYQKALLSTELKTIFVNAPHAPNSLANPRIKAAYAKIMGRPDEAADLGSEAGEGEQKKKRLPSEGDDCPVCYEAMHGVDVKTLTFCDECGNALHTECFQQWSRTANPLTCVWCRAKWTVSSQVASGSATAGAGTSEGYLNLGSAAGVSPVRDTSSYYHGPKRGQSWGYRRANY